MGERIGFICGKGHGHTQFIGEIDYGACGGKEVAEITVSVTDREDLYPEYRNLKSSADVAKEIQEIIREWDTWREEKMWEEDACLRFGDFCYVDTQREPEPTYVFVRRVGEDVTLIDRQGRVKNINGSFVVRWKE